MQSPRPWRVATGWNQIADGARLSSPDPWWGTALASDPPELEWLGHAGFRLHWKGTVLLIDPNLSDRCTVVRRVLERPREAEALGPTDAVLITHPHFDHLDLPTLLALPSVGSLIVPQGARSYVSGLEGSGVPVTELRPWDSVGVGQLEVTAVPAAHNGSRWHPLHSARSAVGFIIRSSDGSMYVAGDTGPSNDFAAIRDRFHPEVAILPIGAFSPAFPVGRYHLSPEQAAQVAKTLAVRSVIPSHFGTFRLALDAPSTALPRFAWAASELGVRWAMPRIGTSSWVEGGS
ncbi:MAG: MBL fold metallo-hydrolase [Thermoanaerobaculia bacterium]|nr:MBL fold metallo-hydrolase [Thermoanaerobaculia bacterium]